MSASASSREDLPPRNDPGNDDNSRSPNTMEEPSLFVGRRPNRAVGVSPPTTAVMPLTVQNPFRHRLQPPDPNKNNNTHKENSRPRYREHFPSFDRAMMVLDEEKNVDEPAIHNNNDENDRNNNNAHPSATTRIRRSANNTSSLVVASSSSAAAAASVLFLNTNFPSTSSSSLLCSGVLVFEFISASSL